MDTIGLLAAWIGILSVLSSVLIGAGVHLATPLVQRWWARTSGARAARRIEKLSSDLAAALEAPDNGYLADLISLYGGMILNLIAGTALVIVSIEVLDLGPALLAAMLPFSINAKLLTRVTGFGLLAGSYGFLFRLSYLVVKLRLKTLPRKPGYARSAAREIARLRAAEPLGVTSPVGQRAAQGSAR
jgi:hypothetical protein